MNTTKGRVPVNKIDPTEKHELRRGLKRKCIECSYIYGCCKHCNLCKFCHYKKFPMPYEYTKEIELREKEKLRASNAKVNPGREKVYNLKKKIKMGLLGS